MSWCSEVFCCCLSVKKPKSKKGDKSDRDPESESKIKIDSKNPTKI